MADEKLRNQNQPKDQGNEKAMGATVTGAQGRQGQHTGPAKLGRDPQDTERNPQDTESAGQGGGIQGSGQRQPSYGQGRQVLRVEASAMKGLKGPGEAGKADDKETVISSS